MKRFLFLLILILLCSCTQPTEEEKYVPEPTIRVYNSVTEGEMWVRFNETELEYFLLPKDKGKEWVVSLDATYHISIRIVEKTVAEEVAGRMERIERIAESKDFEILTEHRSTSISIFKDRGTYIYSLRYFD